MANVLLHPVTKRQLEVIGNNLPQSLLLTGNYGVGLYTIAAFMADKELAATIQPKNTKGEVSPKAGTISVETIRQLYEQTRTKHSTKRVIIIDDAERMSRGAQAAFLKLLEEPNASTYFILTSHEPNTLLATIHSRVQHVAVQPLTASQTDEFITSQNVTDPKKKIQLQFIAPGLPAELARLLSNTSYFEDKAKVISDARTFLQADQYQKLRIIHQYRSNREEALLMLDGAMTIVKHTLISKPQYNLIVQLKQLLEAKERIASNQSIALQLAQIVL